MTLRGVHRDPSHFTVDRPRDRKLSQLPTFAVLEGGIQTLKVCDAVAHRHWALSSCLLNVEWVFISFSASCLESKFRCVYEMPVEGINTCGYHELC